MAEDAIEAARATFEQDNRMCFRVPVWVKPEKGRRMQSHFNVYLERDERLSRPESHFVREGITIAGVRAVMPKDVRAIVSVDDASLSTLLGDSENPAHTLWEERSPKFRGAYTHGASTLRYVKNAPRELHGLLTRVQAGRLAALLRPVFSLETGGGGKSKKTGATPGDDGTGLPDLPAPQPRAIQISPVSGGFRVSAAPQAEEVPARIGIQMAYEVRQGNPFKRYRPLDFELGKRPIAIRARRAKVVAKQGNSLEAEIRGHDFSISFKGFDVHRDLRVQVTEMREDAE